MPIDFVDVDTLADCEFTSGPCGYSISTNSDNFNFDFGDPVNALEYGKNLCLFTNGLTGVCRSTVDSLRLRVCGVPRNSDF